MRGCRHPRRHGVLEIRNSFCSLSCIEAPTRVGKFVIPKTNLQDAIKSPRRFVQTVCFASHVQDACRRHRGRQVSMGHVRDERYGTREAIELLASRTTPGQHGPRASRRRLRSLTQKALKRRRDGREDPSQTREREDPSKTRERGAEQDGEGLCACLFQAYRAGRTASSQLFIYGIHGYPKNFPCSGHKGLYCFRHIALAAPQARQRQQDRHHAPGPLHHRPLPPPPPPLTMLQVPSLPPP